MPAAAPNLPSMSFRVSLRRRIDLGTLGYFLLAALLALFAIMVAWQWWRLEKAVQAGSGVGRYLELVLEARRYEKNWQLDGRAGDWAEIGHYLDAAIAEFGQIRGALERMHGRERVADAWAVLKDYRDLAAAAPGAASAAALRARGQAVAQYAETVARQERQLLAQALHQGHVQLLAGLLAGALAVASVGIFLRRRVLRPLRELERCAEAVARGEAPPAYPGRVWEIGSISQGFRALLDELEARRQGQLRAEKLAALGTLVSGVAHEINNPLNNIATSCQLLLEANDPASRDRLLATIDAEAARAARIVRDLRAYAREPGEMALQVVPLIELVESALGLARLRAPQGLVLSARVPELAVRADRGRLLQVLVNLLENALDAVAERGGAGQVTVEAERVEVEASCAGVTILTPTCPPPWVRLTVADNGVGVAPEHLPRLFDPFHTGKDQGLGLGLFLVQSLVAAHGGGLCVGENPGGGLRVELLLPVAETP